MGVGDGDADSEGLGDGVEDGVTDGVGEGDGVTTVGGLGVVPTLPLRARSAS